MFIISIHVLIMISVIVLVIIIVAVIVMIVMMVSIVATDGQCGHATHVGNNIHVAIGLLMVSIDVVQHVAVAVFIRRVLLIVRLTVVKVRIIIVIIILGLIMNIVSKKGAVGRV